LINCPIGVQFRGVHLPQAVEQETGNIDTISTSEIKISMVIDLAKGEPAIKAVHAAFIG